jgi:hypothetical protein
LQNQILRARVFAEPVRTSELAKGETGLSVPGGQITKNLKRKLIDFS